MCSVTKAITDAMEANELFALFMARQGPFMLGPAPVILKLDRNGMSNGVNTEIRVL